MRLTRVQLLSWVSCMILSPFSSSKFIVFLNFVLSISIKICFSFLLHNHAVHHARDVIDRIYNSGVLVRFLLPYSLDLNPIEEAFAQIKHYLRLNDVVLKSLADPIYSPYMGGFWTDHTTELSRIHACITLVIYKLHAHFGFQMKASSTHTKKFCRANRPYVTL